MGKGLFCATALQSSVATQVLITLAVDQGYFAIIVEIVSSRRLGHLA